MEGVEFKAWGKIPRGRGQGITITEKLDGTNACIVIFDDKIVAVQSRKRFIKLGDDNYGFALWVSQNEEELLKLGDGYHYGEWYGEGIQKNPHNKVGKHLALFNTFRWGVHNTNTPNCVEVVPILYQGIVTAGIEGKTMLELLEASKEKGYIAEGIVSYYHNTKTYQKDTFKYNLGKWKKEI